MTLKADDWEGEYPYPDVPIDGANQATGDDDALNEHVEDLEEIIDTLENDIDNGDLDPSADLQAAIDAWRDAHPEDQGC